MVVAIVFDINEIFKLDFSEQNCVLFIIIIHFGLLMLQIHSFENIKFRAIIFYSLSEADILLGKFWKNLIFKKKIIYPAKDSADCKSIQERIK